MTEQSQYRMPASGEGWRHYKQGPSLYTIVGMANDQINGEPLVVYTPSNWTLVQLPPLYVRPLADFIAIVDTGEPDPYNREKTRKIQRFCFDRGVGHDKHCPFLRESNNLEPLITSGAGVEHTEGIVPND